MEIAGRDLTVLDDLALKAKELSEDIPGLLDQDTTVRTGKPELKLTPNREVLADIQSPAAVLGAVLRGNLEGLDAGTFKPGTRTYDIVVKLDEKSGKDQVEGFLFPGTSGPVLLSSLGKVEETTSPVQITRKDKMRISKLFANLDENTSLTTAVNDLAVAMNEKGGLESGYSFQFSGMYTVLEEGQAGIIEALILSVILVFLTLAAVLGMLPLAIGQGIGAEIRNAAGIASTGGILSSAIISMYLIPVLYNMFTSRGIDRWRKERM